FFVGDRLYKMFIAFDKEMLDGKGFKEFGALMQARFGKSKEIFVDERTKAGGNAHNADALVEAITTKPLNNRDENDNVIDRITGREVTKPGYQAPQNI